jgi:hypothetical protein
MHVVERVDKVLSEMENFKHFISNENEVAQEIIKKSAADVQILKQNQNNLIAKQDIEQKDNIKRLIKLEADSREHGNDISVLKLDKQKITKIGKYSIIII